MSAAFLLNISAQVLINPMTNWREMAGHSIIVILWMEYGGV